MSDDRDREDEDPVEEEDEPKGLGLTEEFARIEDEIERERGPREVRFDETDSTEFVAPQRTPRETDEWAAPEAFEDDAAAGRSEDDAADAVDPDPVPTEVHPAPVAADGDEEPEVDPAGGEADPPEGEEDEGEPEPDGEDAPAPGEAEEPEAAEDAAPPPTEAPAIEHTIVRPEPLAPRTPASVVGGAGRPPVAPPPVTDDVEDRTPALWWRFLTASVLIVAATATAVAINILLFFEDVAADLNPIPEVQGVLDTLEPGDPQTILILGSDKRSNTPGDPGRSDTTMLLRVDGENGVLSLFSLPRDLRVDIPGYGTGKLNEAYTVGGVKKTLKTVKELLGIEIHHVVNVDFQGFADAVDAIDCVYVDVDRDYFNDNSIPGQELYAPIDVNAGYQRLCGQNALDYVRYRHTDTDLVRAARQQDFLSQARRQVPAGEVIPILGGNLGSDLLEIFTDYTSSDIDNTDQIIGTLKAFLAVRNVPVKRVSFDGTIEEDSGFVTATQEQLEKATEEFLGGEDTAGPTGGKGATKERGGGGKDRGKKKEKDKEGGDPTDGSNLISAADASAACGEAQDKFAAFGRTSARRLRFPVWVPTAVVPGSCYDDGSRQYDIKDPDDNTFDAYKMVIEFTTPSTLPEYYGVMGTTWADPPILDDPSGTIEIGDRSYDLYYDGDRLQRIAWHDEKNNSYWISNTLLGTLDENDMLAIAKSMDEAHAK